MSTDHKTLLLHSEVRLSRGKVLQRVLLRNELYEFRNDEKLFEDDIWISKLHLASDHLNQLNLSQGKGVRHL